jgi:hypothetical protein
MTTAPALLLAALAAASPAAAPEGPTAQPAPPPAAGAPAAKPPAGKRPAAPPVASLPTIEGELVEVDHHAHRLRLRTAGGELLLSFDRNTLVLAKEGAVTPLQLTPGATVRAGRDGARAAWVEVPPTPSTPKRAP